jgi:hypothetical protein
MHEVDAGRAEEELHDMAELLTREAWCLLAIANRLDGEPDVKTASFLLPSCFLLTRRWPWRL